MGYLGFVPGIGLHHSHDHCPHNFKLVPASLLGGGVGPLVAFQAAVGGLRAPTAGRPAYLQLSAPRWLSRSRLPEGSGECCKSVQDCKSVQTTIGSSLLSVQWVLKKVGEGSAEAGGRSFWRGSWSIVDLHMCGSVAAPCPAHEQGPSASVQYAVGGQAVGPRPCGALWQCCQML